MSILSIYNDVEDKLRDRNPIAAVERTLDDAGYLFEGQHLFRSEGLNIVSGVGHLTTDRKEVRTVEFVRLPLPSATTVDKSAIRHTDLYLYSQINCNYPGRLRVPMQSAFTEFLRKG